MGGQSFARYFESSAMLTAHMYWIAFPWQDFPAGTKVCDVAGGVGSLQLELATIRPDFQLTLQDLPHVLDSAKKVCSSTLNVPLLESTFTFLAS